jgi:hypothetical protein
MGSSAQIFVLEVGRAPAREVEIPKKCRPSMKRFRSTAHYYIEIEWLVDLRALTRATQIVRCIHKPILAAPITPDLLESGTSLSISIALRS